MTKDFPSADLEVTLEWCDLLVTGGHLPQGAIPLLIQTRKAIAGGETDKAIALVLAALACAPAPIPALEADVHA